MKKIIFTITTVLTISIAHSQVNTIGIETQVNSTATNAQQNPAIAMDANGNYVVVWESLNQDGSGYGIYAQRYNNLGVAQGSETRINTTANNDQRFPAVAMDNSGNYTVVWQSLNQDGDGWGVYLRRFDNTGTALTGQVLVNTGLTTGQQRFADIAMDDDGDFVVVFESEFDVYLQRYNSSGVAQGAPTIVNSTTASSQNYPMVAMDSDGDFVIVWQSLGQDGDGYGVYAQTYNAAGVVQTSEFLVNGTTTNNQLNPDVAMDADGNFTVVWVSNLQDGSQEGIYARQFNSAGTAIAAEFLVNTTTTGAQDNPSVEMTNTGDFIIVWNSYNQDGSRFGVYFKGYIASGHVSNPETRVNTTTTDFQQFGAVGLDTRTTATIVWQDGDVNSNSSVDGNNYAVVQQRYDATALPVELLYFTAKANKETVLLEWATSSEINNEGFHVERSEDGKVFKSLGFVKGAGTSVASHAYSYLDEFPLKGVNYYRLKQIDFDQSYTYTDIRTVVIAQANSSLELYPNPTSDQLVIRNGIGQATITNQAGQVIQTFDIDSRIFLLDLKSLASGQYVLTVKNNEQQVVRQLVVSRR